MKTVFALLVSFGMALTAVRAQEAASSPSAATMDGILLRSNLWETTALDVQPEFKALRFEWTSAAQDTARTAA